MIILQEQLSLEVILKINISRMITEILVLQEYSHIAISAIAITAFKKKKRGFL